MKANLIIRAGWRTSEGYETLYQDIIMDEGDDIFDTLSDYYDSTKGLAWKLVAMWAKDGDGGTLYFYTEWNGLSIK